MFVAGSALNQTPMKWEENVSNIKRAIKEAQEAEVRLLCLPELCITGYGCEDWFLSDWVAEKAQSFLPEIVAETTDIAVCVGLPIWKEGKLYNVACLIDNQQIVGFYAKQHLANEGVHYEPRWFTAWENGTQSEFTFEGKSYPFGDYLFEAQGLKIGFEICEDAWVEDRPAKHYFERGWDLDVVLNPSASHFAFGKSLVREGLILPASKAYGFTYIYSNLLGNEAGRMVYDGDIIIAQEGELLQRSSRMSFKNVDLITAKVNFDGVSEKPTLNPDPKDKNTEFIKASSLAMFDYLRKTYSKCFVLSLSGGADSSTCAVLVGELVKRGLNELGLKRFLEKIHRADIFEELNKLSGEELRKALGKQVLVTAYQGTVNSSQDTLDSAQALAEEIGADFHHWLIDEEVASYTGKVETALGRKLTWEQDDIALQNIQARSRAPIIWMLTNTTGGLLLTTSNRSEGDVGYATMDGDTAGSIAPIAGVDKYFVLNWLQWAEEALNYKSLNHVNNLNPTAELRPLEQTQTDEDDLMPYFVIQAIERLAIKERKSPMRVFDELLKIELEPEALLKAHVIKFFRMWSRNQWKRERYAPSFHLDDFNVDSRTWCRFPILSGGFDQELRLLERA
ncbi:NAD(+) synthase [Persicobacter psychrovividus]|uniref:Glutamine-dependent NAD(+) synthetase n=2 Tax=Persicobacter psychrovividus TaxID=387638 RepID=A0ABM7VF94_9BACT|nr:NAD(+) synthase [Persicobacter psychrovividus]